MSNDNIYKPLFPLESTMKRSTGLQSRHDLRVRRIAGGYRSQGWKVKADVFGYSSPRTLYGKRPDVIATKGKKMRVVEVETRSSLNKDIAQRNAFRRFVAHSRKGRFRTSVV